MENEKSFEVGEVVENKDLVEFNEEVLEEMRQVVLNESEKYPDVFCFSTKSTPAAFQKLMGKVLDRLDDETSKVFLDGVGNGGSDRSLKHIERVGGLSSRFEGLIMTTNASNRCFDSSKIEFGELLQGRSSGTCNNSHQQFMNIVLKSGDVKLWN